ncbi:thioredoxin domain-containing protein [Corynebacterium kroppenstedtii]|uniref:thioredoxin domain-containing protein n=1 Tax=Corynebacterium sp. PCR 32 TaxID=3351342 RepID=UPI0030A9CD9D
MSSKKIKAPNEKSNGFMWAIAVIVIVIAVVIGVVVVNDKKDDVFEKAASKKQVDVTAQMTVDGATVNLKSHDAKPDLPTVDIYDDLTCPHCADLESSTGSPLLDAVDAGKLNLNIRTMNFLDKAQGGKLDEQGSATKALTALYAIARGGNAKLYWNYRARLFEHQADFYNSWGYDEFAKLAEKMGASKSVVKDIKGSKYHSDALKMADSNAKALSKEGDGKVSSPRVFVNGKEVQLKASDQHTFDNWVPQAEKGKVD